LLAFGLGGVGLGGFRCRHIRLRGILERNRA